MGRQIWKKILKILLMKPLIREIKSTFFNKDIIILLIAGPVALTILFGGIYLNSYVNDISIAVLDEDNSSLSRMIVQQFQESERFNVKIFAQSPEELKSVIDDKKVYMGVYIPKDFSKKINTSDGLQVLVLCNGTNLVVGNNAYAAAAGIIQTLAAGTQIKLIESKGIVPEVANNMALAFKFSDRILFDPRMTYMNYLILGFVAVFLQQVILSGIGISVVNDGENIAIGGTIKKLLLKILACSFFALLSTFTAIGIVRYLFNVQIRGSLFTALILCIVFVFAISCPAIILASLLKDKLKFAQIAFMLSLPSFVSCGYVWPQDQMPWLVALLIKIFWPLMNFARPFDEVLFKGLTLNDVSGNIAQLGLYILFWMPIALLLLKKRLKPSKNYFQIVE